MIKRITHSPEETIEYAKMIGSKLKGGDVIAYKGGLGAGKTTFTVITSYSIHYTKLYELLSEFYRLRSKRLTKPHFYRLNILKQH